MNDNELRARLADLHRRLEVIDDKVSHSAQTFILLGIIILLFRSC